MDERLAAAEVEAAEGRAELERLRLECGRLRRELAEEEEPPGSPPRRAVPARGRAAEVVDRPLSPDAARPLSPDGSEAGADGAVDGGFYAGVPLSQESLAPSDEDSPVVSANGVLRRRVRCRLELSDDRRPPSAEREAEYAACEGMDASHPSWEGHDSPDDEEHTFVGSCEEVSCGEDGQWALVTLRTASPTARCKLRT